MSYRWEWGILNLMNEREYIYEFGLTPDDKERLQKMLGIYTLSLEDYGNAKDVIDSLELDD